MARYLAIVVLALGVFSPGAAFGLSCMPPRMDETVIDAAVMIFEGITGPKRLLNYRERATVRKHGFIQAGGGIGDLRVYGFTVTRGWKGVATGQSVNVLFNTYWGDGFAAGEAYLVVSPQQVGALFAAPLCGSTANLKYATDNGFLATLERVQGSGRN